MPISSDPESAPTSSTSSSDEEDEGKPALDQLLAERRKPKADPPLSTVKEIGELPVLHLFSHHLKSFEGGARKERAGQDHVRRVGRLLYEIDGEPKSVRKLWQNLPMNKLCNNFFAGNDLLGKEKRKPQTLKSYVVSYRLFLKFVVSRADGNYRTDLRQVQSALLRLDSWPKAYSDAFNLRKKLKSVRGTRRKSFQRKISKRLATVQRRRSSRQPIKTLRIILSGLWTLTPLPNSGTTCCCGSSQQVLNDVGLLAISLEEFDNGVQHTDDLFVTRTLRHKTAAGGPAKLMWDSELKGMAETYRNVMRPLFANERSVFPSSADIPEKPAFFITAAGQPMNESQISKRIVVLGMRLNPDMLRNLRGSRIRKGIITLQRAEESSTVTDVNLAKQMRKRMKT